MNGWREALRFPRAQGWGLGLALLVSLPTLGLRFFADDYVHLGVLQGMDWAGTPFDLFRFAGGDPVRTLGLVATGPYPWWTLPELRLAFWRPLTSALEVFDHHLFGKHPLPYHLHSVIWYLLLVAAVGALFRRILPSTIGALAIVLFALDDAHFIPVAWVANRNALVAAVPAVVALILHLEARERGRTWALGASVVALAVALAGGESALGIVAYLGAYELVGARGTLVKRLASLMPALLLLSVWAFWYRKLGYGAWGSGTYLDPLAQPLAYLRALPVRALALVGGGLLNLPGELALVPGTLTAVVSILGILGIALFGWGYARVQPLIDVDERRHLRWLLLGAAFSLLPVASTFPSGRLLTIPGIGIVALISALLVHGWKAWNRLATAGLAALHVFFAATAWGVLLLGALVATRHGETVGASPVLQEEGIEEKHVVVLMAPDPLVGLYGGLMSKVSGRKAPRTWWPLTLTPHDVHLTRPLENRIELELVDARFLAGEFEQLFRSSRFPFRIGDTVRVAGQLTVGIEAADERGPRRLSFTFDRSVDDPSLLFLSWQGGALRKFTLPPVGGSSVLPYVGSFGVPL